MSRTDTFERIADELHMRRLKGEDDLSFCSRVAYSGARYWVSAFCMDDGQMGHRGITPQVLGRRLGQWLNALDSIMPGLGKRLGIDEGGIRAIYGRLADVGDILQAGEQGRYLARAPRLEPISDNAALALGFFQPATERFPGQAITGGLATMVLGHFEGPGLRQPWWTNDLAYLPWGPVSAYGELRYINPQTDKWGVGNSDIWSEDGASGLNLTLARCEAAAGGEPLLLAVRKTGTRAIASRIDKKAAQELMNHIRMEAGKPVRIVFRDVDFSHSKAFLPISVLPSQVASTIDALSWPYSHSKDSGARLFRRETVGPVRRLLESYDITTKEIRIGDDSDDHREQR